MKAVALFTLLAQVCVCQAYAQDEGGKPPADSGIAALRKQNAILEAKIKLLTQEQQAGKSSELEDPLAKQREILDRRIQLNTQPPQPVRPASPLAVPVTIEGATDRKDETLIESTRLAYTALNGIAADVAKDLACSGKNIVIYGPAQSETLLWVREFNDQVNQLRTRVKFVLDIPPPKAPDQGGTDTAVFGVSGLAGPVLQSVLDLISLFHTNTPSVSAGISADESGLIASIARAATAQGCMVYWPDQYTANPFNAGSHLTTSLRSLGDLYDTGTAAGKSATLQQKIRDLQAELKRSDGMSQTLSLKIEQEREKLADASKRVDTLRARIDWVSHHITDEKDLTLQTRLNKSFGRSWDDLESALKRQLGSGLPQTIEGQERTTEMGKRVDVLKSQADWLAQYVRDEKDTALQDKLKRTLSSIWEKLDAAEKNYEAVAVSVPKAIEPDQKEQARWNRYSADLKELIATTTAASEAYTAFRGALLDSSSGISPLSLMLRAEALRDLTFDDKFQERAGSSFVQLKLQRIGGTTRTKLRSDSKEGFSGGVILSFVQYEPNGKLKNSGVHTAYTGF